MVLVWLSNLGSGNQSLNEISVTLSDQMVYRCGLTWLLQIDRQICRPTVKSEMFTSNKFCILEKTNALLYYMWHFQEFFLQRSTVVQQSVCLRPKVLRIEKSCSYTSSTMWLPLNIWKGLISPLGDIEVTVKSHFRVPFYINCSSELPHIKYICTDTRKRI